MEMITSEYDCSDDVVNTLDGDIDIPQPRSDGFHVSNIIRDLDNLLINKGLRQPDWALSKEELRRMGRYREMGFMWETIIERVFARRQMARIPEDVLIRQQELCLDNILLTPDALCTIDWVLHEYKATWKSSMRLSEFERNFWVWLVQIKAYCKAMNTRYCRLFIFFVNGNYRQSGPQTILVELTFTQAEIDGNWEDILRHHKTMVKRGEQGEVWGGAKS